MVKVAFIHPDLGIGGAEKAVVDAALALISRGHQPVFVTAHHDPSHCFPETKDGTLPVVVAGDFLPRNICGKLTALFAYVRMLYAAIYLVYFSGLEYDVIFCDQISACIPVLKMSGKPVIFYCHFPDLLLTHREGRLKKLYRMPIDWLEEYTTGLATIVLVNSKFTAGIFHDTFKTLSHIQPIVVYPIPNFVALDQPADQLNAEWGIPTSKVILLSVNRYERKKNLPLALYALGDLKERLGDLRAKVHLVIAGGYDDRVSENKEHYLELRKIASDMNLEHHVTFIKSFSDGEKRSLLKAATVLIYTPDREHFGIVPVEAMYLCCPVIAVKSGGPLETVDDGVTGFLCDQTKESFGYAIEKFVEDPSLKQKMGMAGRDRVTRLFSFNAYTNQLNGIVHKLTRT